MRKSGLFTAAVAVFVLIGIDAWLCIGTMSPQGTLARSSTFNPLVITSGMKGSHYNESLVVRD